MAVDVLSEAFVSRHDYPVGFSGPAEIDIKRHPKLLAVVTDCLAQLSETYGYLVMRDEEAVEGRWGKEGGPDAPFERLGMAKPQEYRLSTPPTGPLILGNLCQAVDALLSQLKGAPGGPEEQRLIRAILEGRQDLGRILKETFPEFFKKRVDLIPGEPVRVTVVFDTKTRSASFPDDTTPVMVEGGRETSLADTHIHIQNASALIRASNRRGLAISKLEVGMIFRGYQTIYGVRSICLEVPESELSRLSDDSVSRPVPRWL